METILLLLVACVLFVFAVTFAVPARFFGFYVAWLAMLATTFAMLPSGPDHSSPFSGTGDAFYAFFAGVLAAACAAKGIFIAVSGRSSLAGMRSQAAGAPSNRANTLPWAFTGALAGFCGAITIALALSQTLPAWIAHVTPVLLVAAVPALLVLSGIVPRWPLALGFAAAALATVTALSAWIWSGIGAVVARAEALAGEEPYCIQVVAVSPAFIPATTRLEFSPLTMRTPCSGGWCWQNHAILAIDHDGERTLKNWSHRMKEFRDDVLNVRTHPPAIVCRPMQHFARDLPLF